MSAAAVVPSFMAFSFPGDGPVSPSFVPNVTTPLNPPCAARDRGHALPEVKETRCSRGGRKHVRTPLPRIWLKSEVQAPLHLSHVGRSIGNSSCIGHVHSCVRKSQVRMVESIKILPPEFQGL